MGPERQKSLCLCCAPGKEGVLSVINSSLLNRCKTKVHSQYRRRPQCCSCLSCTSSHSQGRGGQSREVHQASTASEPATVQESADFALPWSFIWGSLGHVPLEKTLPTDQVKPLHYNGLSDGIPTTFSALAFETGSPTKPSLTGREPGNLLFSAIFALESQACTVTIGFFCKWMNSGSHACVTSA